MMTPAAQASDGEGVERVVVDREGMAAVRANLPQSRCASGGTC